ncbi:MAG: IclR family transcriptional regulator [Pseudomonadota bacterium]
MVETAELKMEKTEKIQGIQVISRAAFILRTLGEDTAGLSLGQIAKRVKLPRSTVQRIIGALLQEGFVSTGQGAGEIRLGPEIQSLAEAMRTDLSQTLKPVMQAICDETGETVDLAILEGDRMLFIDQIVGTHRLRAVSNIGETFPLTTTANGKAALAHLDDAYAAKLVLAEIEEGISGRPLSAILAEVNAVRRSKVARDEDEHTEGICALGIAVRDGRGRIFAISIPVPSSRFYRVKDRLESVLYSWLDRIG